MALEVGDTLVIKQSIDAGGRQIFRAGDRVKIERISPNPQRPEYRYVVHSTRSGQQFQLREEDLIDPPVPPAKKQPTGGPSGPPPNTKKVVLALSLGIVALILIIVAVVALKNSGKTSETTPAAESTAIPATPAAQKTWQTVITFDGNASRRSQSFTLSGGEQRMTYRVTDSAGYGSVICAFFVVPEDESLETGGGAPEVTVQQPGPGDTMLVKEPGNYYLDITSANCQWTLTIQELR
jgi:hypothetical protein